MTEQNLGNSAVVKCFHVIKTLEEHEAERRSAHAGIFYPAQPRKNGIACPTCSAELYDSTPMEMLTVLPPRLRIHCDCGYTGTRTA